MRAATAVVIVVGLLVTGMATAMTTQWGILPVIEAVKEGAMSPVTVGIWHQ